MVSETRQAKKNKHCLNSFICTICKADLIEASCRIVVTKGWVGSREGSRRDCSLGTKLQLDSRSSDVPFYSRVAG